MAFGLWPLACGLYDGLASPATSYIQYTTHGIRHTQHTQKTAQLPAPRWWTQGASGVQRWAIFRPLAPMWPMAAQLVEEGA
jgi:hypothetical protein